MRAFCCASILRMAGTADMGSHISFNATIAQLVASLDLIGANLWAETGALLTWFVDRSAEAGYREEDAFLGVGLLYCALKFGTTSDESLIALCEWISVREEAEASISYFSDAWLHRISPHNLRQKTWAELGRKMVNFNTDSMSPEAQQWIGLIALSLADDPKAGPESLD